MNDSTQFESDENAIALVGMACHLPGALNIEQYWQNLRDGVESIRFYTDEELLAAGESPALLADPNYVRAQPFLEKFDYFDAKFWGFSAQDAAVTDPAHRLFFEVAYQSLEHAGHTGYDTEGTVGVFATSGASLYWMENLRTNRQLMTEMGEFLVRHTGNDMNFLATRFSYELDLRGPSLNVQTACSSSLVAIHLAIQSLLGGECDIAVAGGSTVLLPQQRGYLHQQGEITSPDGHCRPFDLQSAGTVFGSGAGAVVLRRLDDAIADGDTVYAVIAGSAVNNDGGQKVGFLAPGVDGQAGAIAEAQDLAGLTPADISFIEAHGTGTRVGDPIEFEALHQVFGRTLGEPAHCRVGSVKSNIGHLGEAAGIASVIKVVLALQHQQVPATINYQAPNADIDLHNSPFRINANLEHWDTQGGERIAGITALGAGGTNAHIIVKEAPAPDKSVPVQVSRHLLVLSAKTKTALRTASRHLAQALIDQPALALADVAYTLQVGRRAYKYRRALAVADRDEAIALLQSNESSQVVDTIASERAPSLIFMFPGGGAQYPGMGAELYQTETVYRTAFDRCLAALDRGLAEEIRRLVLASASTDSAAADLLERPSRALPALFATEYALAQTMIFWGARPTGFIGHSMGEYTAACMAGVFSVSDAMQMVAMRGELFETVPPGGMLSVALTELALKPHLSENINLAAVNASDLCAVAGPEADIERLQLQFEREGIDATRIRINVAAHSAMLDGILQAFRNCCQAIRFRAPKMPFTSNVTGGWISNAQATDPDYWVRHLRSTVRFSDNVATVMVDTESVLVEVGPGQVLCRLAQASTHNPKASFSAMRHPKEQGSDTERALRAVGQIWGAGVAFDWPSLWENSSGKRVALPTYPFERKAYWVEPCATDTPSLEAKHNLNKRENINDWFSRLLWMQDVSPVLESPCVPAQSISWLVFDDEVGVAEHLVSRINGDCVRVQRGEKFCQLDVNRFSVAASDEEQFEQLFTALEAEAKLPEHIVFLWPVTQSNQYLTDSTARCEAYEQSMERYFWGLFNLAKALSKRSDNCRLTVVSSDLHAINAASCPEKATLLGVVNVLPHELPQVTTQSIDISTLSPRADAVERMVDQIMVELSAAAVERVVAYRGSERWVRRLTPAPLMDKESNANGLKPCANILITGGLGGIGLTLAQHLAAQGTKTLILMSRRKLPERGSWSTWLEQHSSSDATAIIIEKIQRIENLGAKVVLAVADVTDYHSVQKAVECAEAAGGDIQGVIHAAGSMDDALILLKSAASAAAVMDVKIKGALILDSVLENRSLNFFTVFSSVSSFLGLAGQVDYTAANAFLDAFIIERDRRCSGRSLAINWNAWRDVGMAVDAQAQEKFGQLATHEKNVCGSPWFDYFYTIDSDQRLFSSALSLERSWLLSEHKTREGVAIIPGTGFVELLRSAFVDHCAVDGQVGFAATDESILLTDIQFIEAFSVSGEAQHSLFVEVVGTRQGARLCAYSSSKDAPHVVAQVQNLACSAPSVDLPALRARCTKPIATKGRFLNQSFMDFGGRWGCIEGVNAGAGEAMLVIALPEQYASDVEQLAIHPALLDMATGGAQFLVDKFNQDKDFYVPVAYEKVILHAPMPQTFISHVKLRAGVESGFAVFDVLLMDANGKCFIEIAGFTMKKVAAQFAKAAAVESQASTNRNQSNTVLEGIIREAIKPAEGVQAFDRVMAQARFSQCIVSSVDVAFWLRSLDNPKLGDQAHKALSFVKESSHDPDADVEIPAIEKALLATGHFETLVVRSFLNADDDRRLVAFYKPKIDDPITASDLVDLSKTLLSVDALPQQFFLVDSFPLSSTGVIAREMLSDPLISDADTYLQPSTETEIALATLWQEVLGDSRIGLGENFFELGGHSLLLIRLVAKINKMFSVKLPISKLFDEPTLERWANLIDSLRSTQSPTAKKITRVSRRAHELPRR